MAKIGRNEKCPCGSGKKFKHCHGTVEHRDRISSVAAEARVKAEVEKIQRERQQGLGKPIISAEMDTGRRLVAVKNRLLHSKGWRTFPDFLGDYIQIAIGVDWGKSELSKPPEERHPILNWYEKMRNHQEKHSTKNGEIFSFPATGASEAYMHLAYDLYALDHNVELQEKLLARLRNYDNFEGALYEVHVAATMIRAGFEIEFENEDDRSTTHCEFTATHARTGRKFSVEAKHRAGSRLRMGHLLISALGKHANYPRIVFIDVNVPDDGSEPDGPANMNTGIRKLRSFEGQLLRGEALPPAYLFVTNTPWHHHLDSTSFRCGVDIDGFQIPDFKADTPVSLREAIEAREKHIELHELMQSMKDHSGIPMTFDGEIPEFAFNPDIPRLLIGQYYLVQDEDGTERPGRLTSGTVIEEEQKAHCCLTLDTGKTIIITWPLSDLEITAWRKHPDTFFGELGQRATKVNTPLELYDFFVNGYRDTPKERLLELMSNAPDISELAKLDQPQLVSIFAERSVYGAWKE
ncbi:MAG: SEC-C domain-containing protein [Mariprofundaceae bacterium]|nr:SEC-C domain-containing protein [Mariprofundaceae bacterium]